SERQPNPGAWRQFAVAAVQQYEQQYEKIRLAEINSDPSASQGEEQKCRQSQAPNAGAGEEYSAQQLDGSNQGSGLQHIPQQIGGVNIRESQGFEEKHAVGWISRAYIQRSFRELSVRLE